MRSMARSFPELRILLLASSMSAVFSEASEAEPAGGEFWDPSIHGDLCADGFDGLAPADKACVFPFVYNRKKHATCVTDDSVKSKYWCATAVDPDILSVKEWGGCKQCNEPSLKILRDHHVAAEANGHLPGVMTEGVYIVTALPTPAPPPPPSPAPDIGKDCTDSNNHGCDPATTVCKMIAAPTAEDPEGHRITCHCLDGFDVNPESPTSCLKSVGPVEAAPTVAPTVPTPVPTQTPTADPTFAFACETSNGCDTGSTVCVHVGNGYEAFTCECLPGYMEDPQKMSICLPAPFSLSPTTFPTAAPTVESELVPTLVPSAAPSNPPTRMPTAPLCADGSHGCDTSSTQCISVEVRTVNPKTLRNDSRTPFFVSLTRRLAINCSTYEHSRQCRIRWPAPLTVS
jgi:hypothetical protein